MESFRLSSLRARLLVNRLLVVLPAFGVMYYAFHRERERELMEVKGFAVRTADLAATEEGRKIEEARNLLITLSRSSVVRVPESEACRKYLTDSLVRYPRYLNFGVADPAGGVLCSALPFSGRVSIADREFLESYGYRVLLAGSASEARQIARAHDGPIHLLLTDVVMPGESGPVLAAHFAGALPGTKVLYMSGYSDDAVSVHGVLKEGTYFLSKPFTRDILAKKVREVLDAGKG